MEIDRDLFGKIVAELDRLYIEHEEPCDCYIPTKEQMDLEQLIDRAREVLRSYDLAHRAAK